MIPCGSIGGAELGRSDGALGIESASLADVVPGLEGGDAVLFGHVVDGIEAATEDFPHLAKRRCRSKLQTVAVSCLKIGCLDLLACSAD